MFRIGAGAIPFLLPLLLQLVFGFDPFASGSITFVSAVGAMSMKFVVQPILRRFGFRTILLWNSIIAALFVLVNGFFTATTPMWLLMTILLFGGFFRSLQFTSLNAVAYSDMPQADVSQASTLSSAIQQTSIAAGVAFAAFTLETVRDFRGDGVLVQQDFTIAFCLIAAVTAISVLVFRTMPADAGAAVSGHGGKYQRAA